LALTACGKPESQQPPSAATAVRPATVAVASTAPTAATAQPAVHIPNGQLPRTVAPLAYTLAFTMDPAKPSYSGQEQIKLQIKQPLDTIWLHGKGIQVKSASLELANGQKLDIR